MYSSLPEWRINILRLKNFPLWIDYLRDRILHASKKYPSSLIFSNVVKPSRWRHSLYVIYLSSGTNFVAVISCAIKMVHSFQWVLHSTDPAIEISFIFRFCHTMLCKRGFSRHAVSMCVFVTFVHHVKTNKRLQNCFHHRVATPF